MILLNSGAILGIVVAVVVVIALIAFVLYKVFTPKLKQNEKPTEEEAINEEMNRVLKPIDDEETAKKIAEYKDKEDE